MSRRSIVISTVLLASAVLLGPVPRRLVAAEPKAGEKPPLSSQSSQELTVDLGKGAKLEMVLIPAGEFLMGSPGSDNDAFDRKKPQHRVRITKAFYLGKYLVTQAQWDAVMGNNPSYFKGPKNPVEMVSWDDCQTFLGKLNEKFTAGRGKFRLPTEVQWEFACRAGSTTKYCFGDDELKLGEYAWYAATSGNMTHPVGGKKPNAWGLYDMHGNVWEWCQDGWEGGYCEKSPVDDPRGAATGSLRAIRGGSWGNTARYCRSAFRGSVESGDRISHLGLRVSLVPAPEVAQTRLEAGQGVVKTTASEGFRQEEFSIAYWEQVLGPADMFMRRRPQPEVIDRAWDRITAMPAEKAWFLLTQIERSEKPDLWPVERTLDWADRHVPRENILKSLHALPRTSAHGEGNYWLAGRWASLYVRKYGTQADRVYLEKIIQAQESATPQNGVPRTFDNGANEFTYIALASLLDQKSGEAFLVAHPEIPLHLGLYDLYGIEAVCRALPVMKPDHSGNTGIAELRMSLKGDRRARVYQLLCLFKALQPPEGNDDRALLAWRRVYDAVCVAYPYCPVPRSASVPAHFKPPDPSHPEGKGSRFLEGGFLWSVSRGNAARVGYIGYRLEDLDRARKDWIEAFSHVLAEGKDH